MSLKATRSIRFDGNFEQVVGSDKTKFLQECTTKLSANDRDVECVDVRPGSVVVDIRGSSDALDAVVSEVETKGLALPSFANLRFIPATTKPSGKSCNFGVCFDHDSYLV